MDNNRESLGSNLIFKSGNLLESECECLVNTVNTVGVMGKGIALQFKHAYPHMFEMYKLHCDKGTLKVGQIMFYKSKEVHSKTICLFPTKVHWRNNSQLPHIELGLRAFCKYYKDWGVQSAAFPKLGCGNGGLDWEYHVKPLMIKYLSRLPILIEIYE